MSIYFKDRMKKHAEERMEKDLNYDVSRPPNMPNGYKLNKKEFNILWIVFQASEYTNSMDFFKHWTFYLTDDVAEKIIFEDEELERMYCDYDMEECLEEAKDWHLINGFCHLGNNLWIIKDR